LIHDNVRKIREAKGVTKTHLSKQLHMSVMGYSHIEKGNTRLDVERLAVIANILNVEVSVFYDIELTESVIEKIETQTA
jgi:transcriptional regulator with XRE-family HTH domain